MGLIRMDWVWVRIGKRLIMSKSNIAKTYFILNLIYQYILIPPKLHLDISPSFYWISKNTLKN